MLADRASPRLRRACALPVAESVDDRRGQQAVVAARRGQPASASTATGSGAPAPSRRRASPHPWHYSTRRYPRRSPACQRRKEGGAVVHRIRFRIRTAARPRRWSGPAPNPGQLRRLAPGRLARSSGRPAEKQAGLRNRAKRYARHRPARLRRTRRAICASASSCGSSTTTSIPGRARWRRSSASRRPSHRRTAVPGVRARAGRSRCARQPHALGRSRASAGSPGWSSGAIRHTNCSPTTNAAPSNSVRVSSASSWAARPQHGSRRHLRLQRNRLPGSGHTATRIRSHVVV
jgi:hypothetical protein